MMKSFLFWCLVSVSSTTAGHLMSDPLHAWMLFSGGLFFSGVALGTYLRGVL